MDTIIIAARSTELGTGLAETGGQMAGMIAIVAAVLVIAGGAIFVAMRVRNKNGEK